MLRAVQRRERKKETRKEGRQEGGCLDQYHKRLRQTLLRNKILYMGSILSAWLIAAVFFLIKFNMSVYQLVAVPAPLWSADGRVFCSYIR